ncbi:hypothetical protein CMV_025240 [Castanea mollissima]|uniref:Uncharacterized protein n=1 Tax=Castanea mollissima TaxID=60419 RepID=A0A8J4QL51_9ROSI|nr:hypothetical protein CMV_025240 [Castanea mollissima]
MHDIVHDFAQSITKARHLGYSTGSQFPPSTGPFPMTTIAPNDRRIESNKRCRRETGEDWRNISHIPIIKLRDW